MSKANPITYYANAFDNLYHCNNLNYHKHRPKAQLPIMPGTFIASFVILIVASQVTVVQADGWDDFANNLATDLAPLLALFGEQITKQYLSESVTLLDNFIFAMAPLGILTAVVSTIRVCGSASLRAFIGRAQEGGGNAEAELCSSTSRDVCELYHNGGIARVFGRPKLLEIVHDRQSTDFYQVDTSGRSSFDCGLNYFENYINQPLAGTTDGRKL
jgi:hypothetical protein